MYHIYLEMFGNVNKNIISGKEMYIKQNNIRVWSGSEMNPVNIMLYITIEGT